MSDNIITTWYLKYQGAAPEMPVWPADCLLMEARQPSPELSQFLFNAVGQPWRWFSRLSWDYQQWSDYVNDESVRSWVLYQQGTIAGFVELKLHCAASYHEEHPADTTTDSSVELKFFGLLPAFTGQGLGPKLAQAAIALARQWLNDTAAANIWVHTCSADHPAALATYQHAGFVIYYTEQEAAEIPADYADAALCRQYISSRLAHFKNKP